MKQLFFHADLLSMQQGNSKEDQADALLVEDGVITRIGDGESLKAYCRRLPDTILTDLAGACLMPAFIDSHSHIVQVANSLRFVSLAEAKNFDQLCEKMIAALKQRSYAPQEWLIGVGYDHNFLEENRHPDRHILDTISKEHPIMISHASGHMGVTNSKGLSVLAIDENSPNPDGGVIGRDEQGAPNGYLEETAFMQAGAKIPPADQGQMEKLMVQAQRIYAGYGITTAQEGLMKQTEFDLLQSAAHKGLLFMDVVGYADIKQSARLYTDHRELAGRYRHGFRLGGYKLFLDGSPQGRTAWLSKPYLGTPADYCGYPVYSDQQVREFVAFAAKERAQLLTHCNGDEAAAQLLRAFRGEDHGLRPVMIHAQTLRPDQLPELKKIGMIPSYFVAHTYHWGDVHLANLGYERASRISPLASTLRAGIPFTLHQDSPVLPPDMLETVWCAVNRVTKAEQQPAQASPLAEQQPARQRDGAANYDQILTVGPGGYANIQSALDSLQGDNNGSVLVQLSQAYALGYTTVNVIPADKGITSVTIAAAGEEQIKLGTYEDYALFANGIPLIIEKGMVFGVGAKIYGGGSEGQDVNSGTSITIGQQAAVKGVVYGGGKNSSVAGDSEIHIYGEVGSVFGGGYAYAVSTQTRESYHADVNGKTEVYLADTARLTGNVYGGGTAYANSDNTVTKTLQANIGQSVWLTIDSPYITGDIYGGGSVSTTYRGYDKTLRADVQGDVTITLGGSMQFTGNPGESLYGGGTAQSFFNVGDSGDGVPLLSACVNGHVKIDASRDDDASSGHDDWDNSVFMRLYGGGHAKGRYTDATVGSTEIITARKAVDDAAGLFGGGNAEVGGKALVKGNTSVEVVTVANQASGHDNAKNVFGGGRGGYYADATVGGNTTVKINGDISFEPGGVSGVYGGGWVTEEGGSADVTGTAQIILVDTKFSQGVCPGGKGGSITNAATVQAIGESTLAIRDTDGTITQPLSITVGDGLTPTNAKTYFLYNWDGAEKKIDRITINEQATLTQMSNGNVLFWKTEDLHIASGGKVIIDNTKTNNETINGTLSGEGTVQLPAGRQLVVWGGFSGKIALAISGTAAAGSTIAWSPREQDGRFTYQGEGLALAMTDTTEWYRWDLRELRTIRAAVTNPQGGTITPAEQQIAQGEDASLTITCNPGYKVGSILVNGAEQVSALQGNTYTLAEVEQDTTVSVTFTTLQVPDVAGPIDQLPNIDPGGGAIPNSGDQNRHFYYWSVLALIAGGALCYLISRRQKKDA